MQWKMLNDLLFTHGSIQNQILENNPSARWTRPAPQTKIDITVRVVRAAVPTTTSASLRLVYLRRRRSSSGVVKECPAADDEHRSKWCAVTLFAPQVGSASLLFMFARVITHASHTGVQRPTRVNAARWLPAQTRGTRRYESKASCRLVCDRKRTQRNKIPVRVSGNECGLSLFPLARLQQGSYTTFRFSETKSGIMLHEAVKEVSVERIPIVNDRHNLSRDDIRTVLKQ